MPKRIATVSMDRHVHGHAIAGAHTTRHERVSGPVGELEKFRVGDRPAPPDRRWRATRGGVPRGGGEQGVEAPERAWHQ